MRRAVIFMTSSYDSWAGWGKPLVSWPWLNFSLMGSDWPSRISDTGHLRFTLSRAI